MRIHLITAESPASRRLRRGRLIQFPQATMPLIAAPSPRDHHVWHPDEIVESVRFDTPADLVRIAARLPVVDAAHAGEVVIVSIPQKPFPIFHPGFSRTCRAA